jgi:DNA repair protein SbcD/Mre11
MKFVHSADIHLDSPLRGLDNYAGAPQEQIRGATRKALQNLTELCIRERVDFLLIAGDLYDGEWQDYNTGLFFTKQMAMLREAGIKVYLVRGNHDAKSKITRELRLPDGVHDLASERVETLIDGELGLAVHGRGYPKAEVNENLVLDYPTAIPGLFNIGLLHTCAEGREGHQRYSPCSKADMQMKGYHYWALGHVHQREILAQEPWIVFPGNLQGRHARELGPKGATLVHVEHGQVVHLEHRTLDVVRWEQCGVDVSGETSVDGVLDSVKQSLLHHATEAEGRMLAARVVLQGVCEVQQELMRDQVHLREQIRAIATDTMAGQVWIEKVVFRTQAPIDLRQLRERDDPLGALLRALSSLRNDPEQLAELHRELWDLQRKLPPEYFQQPDDTIDFREPAVMKTLLRDVEQRLIPELLVKAKL